MRGKVNTDKLLSLSSKANGGIECTVDESDHPFDDSLIGNMHVHLPVRFVDGTTWLARIPGHNFTAFSDELTNQILLSECATLTWLETANVLAPRLHGCGLHGDLANEVGVAFMLIDRLLSQPFDQYAATEEQRCKIYAQLGSILTLLSRHPFDKIGSLTLDKHGSVVVGPVAGDRTGTLSRVGPFHDASSYYVAWVEEYLRLIASRQLFARFSSDVCLMFKSLRELATSGKCNTFEKALDSGPFYLKHMDDKGDHIMVDDDFNITGITDWSFARVVPAYEAFGPSLVTADMDALYSGRTGLSQNDKMLADALEASGSPVARFAVAVDRIRRFTFGLGMGMAMNLDEVRAFFRGIVNTFQKGEEFNWKQWRSEHLKRWGDDEVLRMLLQGENIGPGH